MRHIKIPLAALGLSIAALTGCDQPAPLAPNEPVVTDATQAQGDGNKSRRLAACDLRRRDFTLESKNDYFPIGVGSSWLLRGTEDGVRVELQIRVLNKTEVVAGVTTRVVEERHFEIANGERTLVEHSRNFYVATKEGTVCYFGEDVDIYEDGKVVSNEGAWRAGVQGAVPGIIMPASPRVGMAFQMEGARGVAEDRGKIVASGVRVRVRAGTFKKTIVVEETNPLTGEVGLKVFARGVGIVVDGPLTLVEYRVRDGGGRDDGEEDDG
jgi:hypothetical protein